MVFWPQRGFNLPRGAAEYSLKLERHSPLPKAVQRVPHRSRWGALLQRSGLGHGGGDRKAPREFSRAQQVLQLPGGAGPPSQEQVGGEVSLRQALPSGPGGRVQRPQSAAPRLPREHRPAHGPAAPLLRLPPGGHPRVAVETRARGGGARGIADPPATLAQSQARGLPLPSQVPPSSSSSSSSPRLGDGTSGPSPACAPACVT
mmetsp:Transcript_26342/g.70315  ORF Transcript_26342/g.70315 Transcript_26342/m.70315 type:complete len:203 (+) Transcript_26342:1143-1751(+)